MENNKTNFAKLYFSTAMVVLFGAIIYGCWAAISYLFPGFLKNQLGFIALRPMHASAALFWILLGATASVYEGLNYLFPNQINQKTAWIQWGLWVIAIVGIFTSYFLGQFGGREYWEFNPYWALPIALAWLLFIIQFFSLMRKRSNWPVYMYMWMTGIVFFLFTFAEGYLWLFPYFRKELITDLTIQWKVNGSMVGSWNQILYGSSFYLMDRITGNEKVGHSKMAFAMYFLGFFNLCFNWGHHIYTLPTEPYIRYLGYVISMTEWIIFIKIIYDWKADWQQATIHLYNIPYRFIMAANAWVFLNLFLALFMSIPAINLYTHGTHVTVAHSMGTTIGINTMIIFAMAFMAYQKNNPRDLKEKIWLRRFFWTMQISLLVFWLSLISAGIQKGFWQLDDNKNAFSDMMLSLKPWFVIFFVSGITLGISISGVLFQLLKAQFAKPINSSN